MATCFLFYGFFWLAQLPLRAWNDGCDAWYGIKSGPYYDGMDMELLSVGVGVFLVMVEWIMVCIGAGGGSRGSGRGGGLEPEEVSWEVMEVVGSQIRW